MAVMLWVGGRMECCQYLKVICGGSNEKQKSLKFGDKRERECWRDKCEAVLYVYVCVCV